METENFAGLRVLIVDDDQDSALALNCLLDIFQCETEIVSNAARAYRVAPGFKPAVVFMDLDMPGADGCEALVTLRVTYGLVDPLFVCLTGTTDPDARARCQAAGFDRFVTKPIDIERLVELLREGARRRSTTSA